MKNKIYSIYAEGRLAGCFGIKDPIKNCPYSMEEDRRWWMDGWKDANF